MELGQFSDKRAVFQAKANMTFLGQASNWESARMGKPLTVNEKLLAEREGFEPPLPFRADLISSQAPSTGLGHLSVSK